MPRKLITGSEFIVRGLAAILIIVILLLLPTTNYQLLTVSADEIEDLQRQIDELNKSRELSVKATKPLEGQLDSLERQLAQIKVNVANLTANINKKQKDLDVREDKLAMQQALLEKRVRDYYIRSYLTDPLIVIFSSFNSGDLFRELSYRQSITRGQDYKTILKAYYGKEPVSKDTGGDINVSGHGSMNFEEKYLYGIAEMPSSWHPEALKAQAVAARTYAYRAKQSGQAICTTEACQVFSKSKSDNPPQEWKDAVNSTRGQIIEDVVTFYASTHGGFAQPIGWDTTDGGGGGSFVDKSYDKLGGSPWVYKAWYTQGYSTSSDKCGRANPWLNGEELADIVNAALVLSKGSSDEAGRVSPVSSCWGGSPYTMDEMRSTASKYGGISSASSLTVIQGNGVTNEVRVNGVTLSGSDFKRAFNLRAPGRLSIPQSSFAFFNIEKK